MGSRIVGPLRGLAPLSPLWRSANFSESLSAYDTEGGLPGEPVPTDPLAPGRVRAQGASQTVALTLLGAPSHGAASGALAYRESTEADALARGWEPPNVLRSIHYPGALYNEDDMGLVVFPTSQRIGITSAFTGDFTLWSPYTEAIVAGTTDPTNVGRGLWVRPRGGLNGADRVYSRGANGISYSDDEGVTWTNRTTGGGPIARMVPVGNDLLELTATASPIRISSDDGESWFILTSESLTFAEGAAIGLDSGGWLVVSIGVSGLLTAYRMNGSTGPESLPADAGISVHDTFVSDAVSLAQDSDGTIYLWAKSEGGDELWVFYSTDRGATWIRSQSGSYQSHAIAISLSPRHTVFAAGSAWQLAEKTADNLTILVRYGGWSGVVHGRNPTDLDTNKGGSAVSNSLSAWTPGPATGTISEVIDQDTWIGNADPDAYSTRYTATGSGTDAVPSTDAALVVTTAANTWRRIRTVAGTGDYAYFRGILENVSGGSLGTPIYTIALSDGSTYYSEVSVVASTTQVRFIDYSTGSAVTLGTATVSGQVEVLAVLRKSGGTIYAFCAYRPKGTTEWTELYDSTLGNDATPPSASFFQFGSSTSGTAVRRYVNCEWAIFNTTLASALNSQPIRCNSIGAWNGAGVYGKAFNGLPYPLGESAIFLSTGGKIRTSDIFTVSPRYVHDVRRLFPEVASSPSRGWRSGTQGVQQLVCASTNARWLGAYSVAIGLFNTNVRGVVLKVWNGSSYTTLNTYDTAITGLRWTRVGDMITVDATGSSTAWPRINFGDFIGADFYLDSTTVRRVVECHGGAWTNNTTARPVLRLEGITGAEGSSGSAGALVPRDVVLIAHKVETPRTRFMIEISSVSPTLPDARHRIGKLVVGGFTPFGRPHGNGWTWGHAPEVIRETDGLGNDEITYLGVLRRSLNISFERMPQGPLQGSTNDADYLAPDGSAIPLIARNDVAGYLRGVFEQTEGFKYPIMVLPAVQGDQYHVIRNPKHILYGRCVSTLSIQNASGNDDDDTTLVQRANDPESVNIGPLSFTELK